MKALLWTLIVGFTAYMAYLSAGDIKNRAELKSSKNYQLKSYIDLEARQELLEEPNELLARIIAAKALKYELEAKALTCILRIESGFNLRAISDTGDYGIGQINIKSWKEFDAELLLSDLDYSVDAAAKVLGYYQWLKKAEEPRTWFCRYNVGGGALTQYSRGANCEKYLRKFNACYMR